MEFTTLLKQNREAILGKWFDLVIKTYPPDTSKFLAKQKDRFHNPVGHVITEATEKIFDQIVSTMDAGELQNALDGVIRIRSVQDFTPSQAVAFVFGLKSIIREVLGGQTGKGESEISDGLAQVESRIDRVALLAFDKYTECREKLHEIRTNEIRSRSIRLLDKLNLESDISEHKGEPTDDDV